MKLGILEVDIRACQAALSAPQIELGVLQFPAAGLERNFGGVTAGSAVGEIASGVDERPLRP